MTPRLLADENVPRPSIVLLRNHGLDVEAVAESMPGASDARVIETAVAGNRWVLTFDRDYGELVFARRFDAPQAIVYFRQASYAPTWPAEVVLELLKHPESMIGYLVVVGDRVVRRRLLPPSVSVD